MVSFPPLFVYGTLRDPDLRAALLPTPAIRAMPARAPGWRAVFAGGHDFPVLRRCAASAASGLVLMGLTRADRFRLDRYEGPLYRLTEITVQGAKGPVRAVVYLPHRTPPATARPWCLENWQRREKPRRIARHGALDRWAALESARPGSGT